MTQHILVVDEDRALNTLVADVLRDEGYEVEAARDGGAAREALTRRCPDAVVLDLSTPVSDGRLHDAPLLALYDHLRVGPCATRVLILSAHGAHRAMRELGADAALDKPFDIDQLIAGVEQLFTQGPEGGRDAADHSV